MDKFPVYAMEKLCGQMTVEQEAQCAVFTVRCHPPEAGVWNLWAVGETGALRLGIPDTTADGAVLRRRFSQRMAEPAGRLRWGELRRTETERSTPWQSAPQPECLFSTPFLQYQSRGIPGALSRCRQGLLQVAFPWSPRQRFPMPALFCFARIRSLEGQMYAVFTFDRREQPLFLE